MMESAQQTAQVVQVEQAEARSAGPASQFRQRIEAAVARVCPQESLRKLLADAVEQILRPVVVSGTALQPGHIKKAISGAQKALQARIAKQFDLILHAQEFRRVESVWRGLKFLVDRTDFDYPIKIDLLNVSKEHLRKDLMRHEEFTQNGLYHHLYKEGIGLAGADPFSAVMPIYEFDPSEPDIEMLDKMALVAQRLHTPMIASAAPQFFGLNSYSDLPSQKLSRLWTRLEENLDGDPFNTLKWREFRGKEHARYIGLALPRFVVRKPWGKEHQNPTGNRLSFYKENVFDDRESYLWSNAAFAFSSRMTDSFAKNNGWYDDVIGFKSGGRLDDLPLPQFKVGSEIRKMATECMLTDDFVHQLSMLGFVPLVMNKNSSIAFFQNASSVQRPKVFPETPDGLRAQENYQLGTQLPYMLMVSRVAHYTKVIQREYLGSVKQQADIQQSIEAWLKQYHCADDTAEEAERKKKPLRDFRVVVEDVAGQPGYYTIDISIQPFVRYAGADVKLSLAGRINSDAK